MAARVWVFVLILAGLAGVVLLANSLALRRETVAEAAFPPTGQILDVGGVRVHAHVADQIRGAGPDLILLHGASGSGRDFTFALVDKLAQDYRVIAFDRPGLGWTDGLGDAGVSLSAQAGLLRAASAQLRVHSPIILGQSYGGAVALAWALDDPGGVAALVLIAAASEPWPGALARLTRIMASPVGGATVVPLIAAFAPQSTIKRAIAGIFAPQHPPAGYISRIGAGLTLRRETLRINARQVNGLKAELTAQAPRYPGLSLPVELLHGTADTIVPLAVHSQILARQIPGAHLVILPGAGHMIQHTDTAEVIAAIHRAAVRAGLR